VGIRDYTPRRTDVSDDRDDKAHGSRPPAAAGIPDEALLEINRLWTIVRAFSNVAHDVNNALQVIAGSAELMEASELEPPLRRRVEAIGAESARAAALIDRLLSYSRAEHGLPQAVEVRPLVEAAVALRLASANHRRVTLTVERQSAEPCRAAIDRTRALQALLDLLFEAEEAVAGRANARIVVSVETAGNAAVVRIATSAGAAITGDEPAPDRGAGELTGGAQLWAAKAIVEAMRGSVTVEASDTGRTFLLRLPAA